MVLDFSWSLTEVSEAVHTNWEVFTYHSQNVIDNTTITTITTINNNNAEVKGMAATVAILQQLPGAGPSPGRT